VNWTGIKEEPALREGGLTVSSEWKGEVEHPRREYFAATV